MVLSQSSGFNLRNRNSSNQNRNTTDTTSSDNACMKWY